MILHVRRDGRFSLTAHLRSRQVDPQPPAVCVSSDPDMLTMHAVDRRSACADLPESHLRRACWLCWMAAAETAVSIGLW